eukprot:TRINITY_DN620_c0_g3_i1.p3 TRINITY_DN620_c0_g3~~TRINITY_DN620_c0_g3_i1.p3  ORF type:complete len:890 (-),score=242.58 TRINITY_DN620_c0_g3_i1:20457-23126(-)
MEDISTKTTELEALDREFQELLKHIAEEPGLEKYRSGYNALYKTFRMSFDNQKRLVKQCRELNDMIINNATNVKVALEMSQEDSNTIKRLRKEIEKAWQFVEKAKEKEERSKKMVQDLKEEITHLNNIVGQGATLSLGPENNVDELLKTKENLTKQNEEKKTQIAKLEAEINSKKEEKAEQERKAVSLLADLKGLKEDADRYETDNKRKDDKIKHQEEQYKNIMNDLNSKEKEKQQLAKELEITIKECKDLNDSVQRKTNEHNEKTDIHKSEKTQYAQLEREKKAIEVELNNLKALQAKAKSDIDSLRADVAIRTGEKNKWEKNLEKLKLKERKQIDKIKALESEKKTAISTIKKLERDLDQIQKEMDSEVQLYRNLREDNKAVHIKVYGAEEKNTKLEEELDRKEEEIANQKRELEKKKKEYAKLLKEKENIEAEKAKLFAKVAKTQAKVQQLQEDCKLKDNLHTEIERKMMEYKEKAKEKEQLYEVVRSDRNLYSKNLIEKHDEMNELKRKFDITTQQINQLKEELEAKDKALVSKIHEFEQEKQEKEKKAIQVQAQEAVVQQLERSHKEKDTNIKKLTAMLKDGEARIKALQKSYEKAIRDKDVFGTELIRRNDELTLLCEKIKILQSTLAKAEIQFKDKESELRLLKTKIAENKNRISVLTKQAGSVKELKKEIYLLTSSLLQERMQVQALSEELENPVNIHRWRKLEGSDPDTYEMLQKIQALQKRLIKKTEEVVDREGRMQEKASQVQQLEQMLARQPEFDAADSINVYQQKLKEKTKQMKSKAAELNMYQAQVFFTNHHAIKQVNEFKYEIERLTSELQEIKTRYYEQKRREQIQREAAKNEMKTHIPAPQQNNIYLYLIITIEMVIITTMVIEKTHNVPTQ